MTASQVPRTAREVPRGSGAASRDETTRLLCAAAHRHERFAGDIVRFYLAEQVGAVPPSPGLDAAAAMRDAVAAQSRRFVRDVLVLLLLVLLCLLAPLAVVIWLVVVVPAAPQGEAQLSGHGRWIAVVGTLALLALIGAVQAIPFTHLLLPALVARRRRRGADLPSAGGRALRGRGVPAEPVPAEDVCSDPKAAASVWSGGCGGWATAGSARSSPVSPRRTSTTPLAGHGRRDRAPHTHAIRRAGIRSTTPNRSSSQPRPQGRAD